MFKKYYKNRITGIESHLVEPLTVEGFHQLRIDIKKLNALFSLIEYCDTNFKRKKTFAPLKKIFSQAGKVRELQVEISMLKKHKAYFKNTSYVNQLKLKLAKEKASFFVLVDSVKGLKKTNKEVKPELNKINKKRASNYISDRKKKIESLLGVKNLKANMIHEMRKRFKVFFYTVKSASAKTPARLITQYDKFQELLGQWHDHRIAIDYLNKVIKSGKLKPDEFKRIEKSKGEITAKLDELFLKLNIQRKTLPPLRISGFN